MPLASAADWQSRVDALWAIFDTLDAKTFLEHMRELVAERPQDDPLALFELASAHDSTDHEAEAAALYRQALAIGLPDSLRRRVSIQLASTLRNLGQAEAGVAILRAEQAKASDDLDDAVAAFLALCLSDMGRDREALSVALTALSPHLPRYNRSLTNYAKALLAD
ncbi:putative Zn-dependent protease [Devosia sp. UYZn731]|uniref:tetratricopeptide repeat protein n=1 Tax=Devosia sp. UYZn731 TaxID=3156345 RepID=UPI0033923A08